MAKISVLFTGGTIGSSVNENGYIAPDGEKKYALLEQYKSAYGKETEFVFSEVCSVLSENMNAECLKKIASAVKKELEKDTDGVILTHGTDTLQYTAAALSYEFCLESKPIVLVSANYILSDERSNGVENFAAAVSFISARGGSGVFCAYKNTGEAAKIHRGTRLLPHLPYSDSVFSLSSPYGTASEKGFEKSSAYNALEDEMKPLSVSNLSEISPVLVLESVPLELYPKIPDSTKAVILSSYHSGTLCTQSSALKTFTDEAKQKKVAVFVSGAELQKGYESTENFSQLGIKLLPKMSPIAAYVKLSLIISAGLDLSFVEKPLSDDMA